ncbi:hypothetical protein NQ317_011546 [Molorchus minor]|uniref:SET domain-containing protein n=1 Tax=Molorchus minor TaxID=1323400 RepID=A0ABQ9K7T3_9CUCU|nr:hypothetical protein NQ317_011546 [Molorchus minor]
MGRTATRRSKKINVVYADHLKEIIDLRRWLSKYGWSNVTKLKLAKFPDTDRGVMSSKRFKKGDTIIAIPLDLMITYKTVSKGLTEILSLSDVSLEIHDLLTLFLVTERCKEQSLWSEYINSLPQNSPPLPWLASPEELNSYPADLQIISERKRKNLEESLYRTKRSIKKHPDCVLDEDLFKWGYVLVNTRAVYIHPDFVRITNENMNDALADEPTMALCPFLDMFNHHFQALTESEVVYREGQWFYQLKTLTGTNKYDQIFISYGAHDNIKLLMEYGFFLADNKLDTVKFGLEEVLKIAGVNVDSRQYKFIKDHNFDNSEDLYIGYEGISFNLKAVLFVICNAEVKNFNYVVFGNFPDDFLKYLPQYTKKLLFYKKSSF